MAMDGLQTGSADTSQASATSATPISSEAAPSSTSDSSLRSTADETAAVFRQMTEAGAPGSSPGASPAPSDPNRPARGADGTAEADAPVHGEAPPARIQAAVKNAREQATREAEQAFHQRYGPASELDSGVKLFRALQQDPRGFLAFLQSQLTAQGVPDAPAAPAPPQEPTPDLEFEDGRKAYSADQLRKWQEWHSAQLQTKLDEKFGPMLQEHALTKLQVSAKHEAQQIITKLRAEWPMFSELEEDIKDRMLKDGQLSHYDAYIAALRDKGLPSLREQATADRTGQLQRKAAASTVQPGAARPATPRTDRQKTTRELTAEAFALAARA